MLARSLPVFSSSSALFAFLFPAKHLLPLWPHIEGVCKWERADEGKVRVTLLPEYCQAFGGGWPGGFATRGGACSRQARPRAPRGAQERSREVVRLRYLGSTG